MSYYKKLLFFGAWVFSHIMLLAQDHTPKYSNEFLSLGVGARYMGMGMTAVAYVDDVTSGYWNPSALVSQNPDHQLILMHASYFAGIANYDYGAFSTKLDSASTLGISILRFSVDDIPDTRFLFDANGRINYDNIRFFSASDYAFLVSYARKISGIDFGANVKIIHRIAGSFSHAWGFGLDVGARKQMGKWQLGLVGKDITGTFNAWSHDAEKLSEVYATTGNGSPPSNTLEITLPRIIFGVARIFSLGEKFTILTTLDTDWTWDGKRNTPLRTSLLSIDPHMGAEIGFLNIAFLRLGVSQFQQVKNFSGENHWTFLPAGGIGFRLSEVTIDYAMTDIGDAAAGLYSHIFSIKVDFNAKGK